ncbi:MAG: SPOR domain-containing protein [Legionella sp.]|nr:SPOR domain-containing protein [Legionella sp.]
MAREYSSRRPSKAQRSAPRQFLVVTITFLLGYLTATVFDAETLTRWINAQVTAHQETNNVHEKPQAQQQAKLPPKPKFEFYTLLADDKAAVSQPATPSQTITVATKAAQLRAQQSVAAATAATTTVASKPAEIKSVIAAAPSGNYLVQVASFKARQDAEEMKGLLILKGFSVYISPISHPTRGNWFRVVVGPYSNRNLAQQAQGTLAQREHLRGVIIAG